MNQNPHSACYPTINAALSAAGAGDTIDVAPGVYKEYVQVTQSVSLVGAGPHVTFIDATGEPNAILVGSATAAAAGPTSVVVTGFTLENADYEGILVHDSSSVTIWGNRVINNDTKLSPGENASCDDLTTVYSFEFGEAADCGEGIHLLGSDHSAVYDNTVEYNAGGILLSDEDKATDNNSIRDNTIRNNVYDCGITLASHSSNGVFDNTIADNYVSGNGTFAPFGAGIGLFSPGAVPPPPATGHGLTENYGNVVVDNDLVGNGLAGVALHTHAPAPEILKDDLVIGNRFSGNGGDSDLPTLTGPPSPQPPNGISLLVAGGQVSGLVFSQNRFANESVDIAVNIAPSTPPVSVTVQLNKFQANAVGIENMTGGTINATENWWGCSKGPGAHGCSTVSGNGAAGVIVTPWLTNPANSN